MLKLLKLSILIIFTFIVFHSCKNESNTTLELSQKELNLKTKDSLKDILDKVYIDDQDLRRDYKIIEQEFGWDSPQAKELWSKQQKLDSINLTKVTSIIDDYGWLSIEDVGEESNSALFLVLQHSDLETQLKYLPILKKASEQGKASKPEFAYFQDRILVNQERKQIYGTQYLWDKKDEEYYLAPIIEPEKINERGASVGLETIEEFYVNYWNKEWNLEDYVKKIDRIENDSLK